MIDSECDPNELGEWKHTIPTLFATVDTFQKIVGGSETNIVDPNLQNLLSAMASYSKGKLSMKKMSIPYKYLAKSMNPENCLYISEGKNNNLPCVVGAKVKSIEASIRNCYPQLIAVSGSSAIESFRLGLKREDCVTLGIAMTADLCQFCAVYLMEASFPVLVELSPPLQINASGSIHCEIAKWCLRFIKFSLETAEKLQNELIAKDVTSAKLVISGYFAKPVRDNYKVDDTYSYSYSYSDADSDSDSDSEQYVKPRVAATSKKHYRLNKIMHAYEKMRKVDGIESVVLFPTGIVTISSETSDLYNKLLIACRKHFSNLDLELCHIIFFPLLKV